MRAMSRLGLAAVMAVAACTDAVNEPAVDPATKLNETVFRCNVEPILARQCSYNACHGQEGTALRVYTPGKLRATPPANIRCVSPGKRARASSSTISKRAARISSWRSLHRLQLSGPLSP